MAGIGAPELIIVLVIVLLLFGARRLPELGRSLGSGMREFKDSVTSKSEDGGDDDGPAALDRPSGAEQPAAAPERTSSEDPAPQPRA